MKYEFDYLVIGADSAGCMIASSPIKTRLARLAWSGYCWLGVRITPPGATSKMIS